MFDPPRYATRGIIAAIPPEVQFTLWAMVDILRHRSGVQPDYLQVFELFLSGCESMEQKILHRQEQPPYIARNLMYVDAPVSAKVFIVDDGEHATMMLGAACLRVLIHPPASPHR